MQSGFRCLMLAILCSTAVGDTVEMGEKIYSDVLISGITRDKICFVQAARVNTDRPLKDVTKLKIDSFPDFNRAEELASLAQYQQAMEKYLEAYRNVKTIKKAWQMAEMDYLDKGQNVLSETCNANLKSEWIKDLIKLRYARLKSIESEGTPQPGPQAEKESTPESAPPESSNKFCPECRGKGTVKCVQCNGSGKLKCTHTGAPDGRNEQHSHYYELCPICKGKGKLLDRYQVWIGERHIGTRDIPGYYTTRTRKIPCTNPKCTPYPKDPRIFVVWMCPYCAVATYPGYVDCPNCEMGRCRCDKCGGIGKITNDPQGAPTTAPGSDAVASDPKKQDDQKKQAKPVGEE